ncbi:Ribokinase-like protein [Lipomyces kononenkoae]|uniref:Ribokinase-like protein n=1 Tax=Lipomyces kononenkoae TaxID=34357 RepID=A0ACC3T6Z9_LIPKO
MTIIDVSATRRNSSSLGTDEPEIIFTSLGMFIIDEIHHPDGTSQYDVIGGAGTYAAYAARYFLPYPLSKRVGWVVDAGSDFPPAIRKELFSLQTTMIFREDHTRLTTRGWNGYGENEFREFRYMTPKKRIVIEDIIGTKLVESRTFHVICAPERAQDLINGIVEQRNSIKKYLPLPVIVWEPVPDLCTPEYLDACFSALPMVTILTPNAAEAAAFFGLPEPFEKEAIEAIGLRFLPFMREDAAIVIRAGAQGCFVLSKSRKMWLEAYHAPFPDRVIDPTGAGNSFVGGMCTGYVLSNGDIIEASIYGNVAAGLSIEQVGIAKLTLASENGQPELWNGSEVTARMKEYKARIGL